MKTARSQTICR